MLDDYPELVDTYKPGGFHPIALGDNFCDSRYTIIRKLGHGSFSTVWLAEDNREKTFVAFKILSAEKQATQEVDMLRKLDDKEGNCCGRDYVVNLRDHFWYHGPNGNHQVLVFDAMGPNVYDMSQTFGTRHQMPLWMAKKILQQTLEGASYMHSLKVAHGDIHVGNVLFGISKVENIDRSVLVQQHVTLKSKTVGGSEVTQLENIKYSEAGRGRRKRGICRVMTDETHFFGMKPGISRESYPEYLAHVQVLADFATTDRANLHVRLADLGGAFPFGDPPLDPPVPVGLRSPELVTGQRISEKHDVWAFGCMIFEVLTGYQLFPMFPTFSNEEPSYDDDLMLAWTETLGIIPKRLRDRWPKSSEFFDDTGNILRSILYDSADDDDKDHNKDNEKGYDLGPKITERLRDPNWKPPEMSAEEVDEVGGILKWLLQYDPADRPTFEEVKQHPWFLRGDEFAFRVEMTPENRYGKLGPTLIMRWWKRDGGPTSPIK